MAKTIKISAPSLGGVTITGVETAPTTVQFRGLTYATIEKRYDYPTRVDAYTEDVDATKYGPSPPQPFRVMAAFLPRDQVPTEAPPPQDELACLNLNITRPTVLPADGSKIPVVVWIFPGANTFGSASDKSYEPSALVARSASKNLPILFVNINYRLSLLGFVYVDGRANHAVYDQLEAMRWVKAHIGDFGGDAENITLMGESAGSLGTHYHALNPLSKGLFRRIGMMSTVVESRTPFPIEDAKGLAAKAKRLTGTTTDEEFKAASVEDLMEAVGVIGGMYGPVDDGGYLGESILANGPYIDKLPIEEVEAVMLGNTFFESIVYEPRVALIPAATRLQRLLEVPIVGPVFASKYGITAEDSEENLKRLMQMYEDLSYGQPVDMTVKSLRAGGFKTYHYLFDQPNPYDPGYGAHHGVDVLYFFNSFKFDASYDVFVDKYQTGWIRFFYGLAPWDFMAEDGHEVANVVFVDKDAHERAEGELEKRRRADVFAFLNQFRYEYDAYNITKRFLYVTD
ncbi:Alpha/Beta hydrolase protein [Limtongia smithiae]|uniref:Alpha/Beta hydrolase protein n=1 Tax=Limtongia smithiae TaxID=1125753 RepID=UPI0034CDC62C